MSAETYNRSQHLDEWLVRLIQAETGAVVDGDPGPETASRVQAWQGAHGLCADGKIGPATLRALAEHSAEIRITLDGRGCSSADVAEAYPERVQLLDVSYHQDTIKWATLAARSGVSAVIIKATEGRGYIDPQFDRNRREAEAVGLPWSSYHYAHLAWRGEMTDPVRQADHFLKTTGAARDGRRLWLDLERKTLKRAVSVSSARAAVDWALAFLEHVDAATGQLTGVYTSQGQVKEYLGEHALDLRGRPTWWAYYPRHPWPWQRRDEATRPPKHPAGFGWDIWQYSGEGRAPGVDGAVDLNVFNGDLDDLMTLFETKGGGCG